MQKYIKLSLLLVAISLIIISFLDLTSHTEPSKIFTVNTSNHIISGSEYSSDLEISIAFNEKESMYTYKSNAMSATIYNDDYSVAFEVTNIAYISRTKIEGENYYVYKYTLRPLVSGSNMIIENTRVKLIYKNIKEIDIEIGELSIVRDSNLMSNELEIVSKLGTVSTDGSEIQMNGLILGFRNKSFNSVEINRINLQSNQVCIVNSLAITYENTDNNIVELDEIGLSESDIDSANCSDTTKIEIEAGEIVYYFFPLKYSSDIVISNFPLQVSYKVQGLNKTYLDYEWKYFDLEFSEAKLISEYIIWGNL